MLRVIAIHSGFPCSRCWEALDTTTGLTIRFGAPYGIMPRRFINPDFAIKCGLAYLARTARDQPS